ncbi:Esterase/lipase [Leucobacter sp. 7(1)]|uniref:alpha/beta hydrolase n=1 Tax=Leucobacter sp. 7(1) TaxID=1255613 RepID=UPI00097EBD03|nr:alpha/beta hydrolase fold domain-containing protein [Leucobacter sp. 7(1)]SJN13268.1 Esterase/lipase [Leucobacter sp. 7(1)]
MADAPANLPVPVPYDPELLPGLAFFRELVEPIPLTADTIAENRAHLASITQDMATQTAGRAVTWENRIVPGPPGAPDVAVTIVRPAVQDPVVPDRPVPDPAVPDPAVPDPAVPDRPVPDPAVPDPDSAPHLAPAVLGIHGGGYVLGTRFFGTGELIDLAETHGTVGVAVEYRLAPEHPAPAAAEDCYAALVWLAAHAAELGIDPARIVVSGASAGGGLAAAVALLARDRGGPALAGQLLNTPMIDDRNNTDSSWQYVGVGAWDRGNNDVGWDAALGDDRGTERVEAVRAPARATDLSGLAPAFLEVGAAEVFRDETIAYASRIWAAGGQAELHVWSGAYHGFSGFSPDAVVSHAANAARDSWWRRILAQ